jgi:multidrug transporter EmrE-like cation transporter
MPPQTSLAEPPPAIAPNPPAPRRTHAPTLLCLCLVVGFVTTADLLLKTGATAAHQPGSANLLNILGLNAFVSPYTLVGICFHLLGLGAWMITLRTVPLTVAYCFTAAQQATIALGAWLWLGEAITPLRWAGIAAVLAGLLLLVPAIIVAETPHPAPAEAAP